MREWEWDLAYVFGAAARSVVLSFAQLRFETHEFFFDLPPALDSLFLIHPSSLKSSTLSRVVALPLSLLATVLLFNDCARFPKEVMMASLLLLLSILFFPSLSQKKHDEANFKVIVSKKEEELSQNFQLWLYTAKEAKTVSASIFHHQFVVFSRLLSGSLTKRSLSFFTIVTVFRRRKKTKQLRLQRNRCSGASPLYFLSCLSPVDSQLNRFYLFQNFSVHPKV